MISLSLAHSTADIDWRWVTAAPFRAHLRHLLNETGLPWRVVAGEAGLPDRVVRNLLHGREGRPLRRIAPHYARRLLRLEAHQLSNALRELVPASAAHAAAHRLLGSAWSAADIAVTAEVTIPEADALLLGRLDRVPRRVQVLLDAAVRAHGLQPLATGLLEFTEPLDGDTVLVAA